MSTLRLYTGGKDIVFFMGYFQLGRDFLPFPRAARGVDKADAG